ncbi:hypothetical protein M427DRAFT_138104 [Gonapodya prolifera JEL478]|uniref:SUZ domain-containing protein n=1 Tax=Gonapodya prolifera (strain JEL478) TaxID=1344416 RepID=A0A139A592_GONPJ|nr:hypothetical protein M427DRAFT_138104 [Gonapodya prolifera JEL478]|eukprot:KXS11665.1 hypothetical protein M427DRAFT_138104 [Gonapodya prolifera JEL478]
MADDEEDWEKAAEITPKSQKSDTKAPKPSFAETIAPIQIKIADGSQQIEIQPSVKLLKRNADAKPATPPPDRQTPPPKSLEQRQLDYVTARSKIFGESGQPPAKSS